jgi:hypothetical protein
MTLDGSAWEKAAGFIERAQAASDHETRAFYLRLAIAWSRIADNYEFLARTDALTPAGTRPEADWAEHAHTPSG